MPVPWQVPSNAAAGEPKVGPGLGLDIVAPGLRVHFNSPCCALLVRQPQNNPPRAAVARPGLGPRTELPYPQ